VYPDLQAHEYDPSELVQVALPSHGLVLHSLMSLQTVPFPVNPKMHVHINEPGVSAHVELEAQLLELSAHSSIFEQWVPLPRYPVLQAHEKLPAVSVHVALLWQLSLLSAHSSILVQ
jgi:hypothetical protein